MPMRQRELCPPEIVLREKHGLGSLMADLVNLMGSRVSQKIALVTSVRQCLDWVNCEKANTVGGASYGLGFKTE